MTHPTTIREVARRAGVSTATVSRVLAGVGRPKPETVSIVQAAVEALGYRPSGVARSLRMRHTATIGLVITDIQNPFFPDLVRAADVAARELGYSIILGSAAYDEDRALHYLDLMTERRVDGLVIASSQVSDVARDWLRVPPVPVVVVNAEPGSISAPVITSDNRGGAVLAVEHLVALGHRRIACIGGPATFTASQPRLEGFRAACTAAGLSEAETPIFPGEGTVESGEQAAAQILSEAPGVTAIAAYNDLTAIGLLRALRAAGRSVPRDVSVVGFDDIAAASWTVPTLTTVAQQKAAMGRLAIEYLAATIGGQRDPADTTSIRLPTSLIVRESTGPAPVEPAVSG